MLASEVLANADFVFYTVPASQGLARSDLSFIADRPSFAARIVVLMTKTDLLDSEEEIRQQVEHVRKIAQEVSISRVVAVNTTTPEEIDKLRKFILEEVLSASLELKSISITKKALNMLPVLLSLIDRSLEAGSLNMDEIQQEIEKAQQQRKRIQEEIKRKIAELKRKVDLIIRNEVIDVRKALVDAALNTVGRVVAERNYAAFNIVAIEILEKAAMKIEGAVEEELNIFVSQGINLEDIEVTGDSRASYSRIFLNALPVFLMGIPPVFRLLKGVLEVVGGLLMVLRLHKILDPLSEERIRNELVKKANEMADDFRERLYEYAENELYPKLEEVAENYSSEQLKNIEQAMKNALEKAEEKKEDFENWKARLNKHREWIVEEMARLRDSM
ncbi:MAG: hypothetical protein WHS38_05770 [Thermodesulforhabdaceae bacterium]